MTKTIYYEAGLPATLIPVQFIGWAYTPGHVLTERFNAVIRLKRSSGAYRRGEVLHVPARSIVTKAFVRDYHQFVNQAPLPALDDANIIPARY